MRAQRFILTAGCLSLVIGLTACQTAPPAPDDPTVIPDVTAIKNASGEGDAWQIAKASPDSYVLQAFLARYPDGPHSNSAKLRLKLIQDGAIK